MRMTADFFLALRYLRPKRTFVSVITLLSILGPVLGVAVLIIVSAVMAGFDRDIRQSIIDMQSHVQLYPLYEPSVAEPDKIISQLKDVGVVGAPLIEGSALIQVSGNIVPKVIKGIVPEQERLVSNLSRSMLAGRYEIKDGEAIVGDRLASQLRLKIGDSLLIHSPARLTQNVQWKDDGTVDVRSPDDLYLPEQVRIVGLYSMGVADFDDNIVFLTLDQAAELFGKEWDTASCIQCRVPDPMNIEPVQEKIQRMFPRLEALTWKERNRMLFGTLRVEKNLMTFLMAFIVLVASFSIAATLITVVVQKTREIGVMKAVGMSWQMVARVFLLQGAIIGVLGTAFGTALGLLIIAFREKIADLLSWIMGTDVFPAELYHLRKIPALVTSGDLAFIVLLSLAICVLAAVVPALYASSLAPAHALQEEN